MPSGAENNGLTNIHATAIVLGSRGILIIGPSGSGKSSLAFTLMAEARNRGAFTALIADDQVLISRQEDSIIAHRPASIAGLLEIRGSGIATVPSIASAPLHLAVRMISLSTAERLPPENEMLDLGSAGSMPLVRISDDCRTPLAVLAALRPDFCRETPFNGLA